MCRHRLTPRCRAHGIVPPAANSHDDDAAARGNVVTFCQPGAD
jgi:hypothetical protein